MKAYVEHLIYEVVFSYSKVGICDANRVVTVLEAKNASDAIEIAKRWREEFHHTQFDTFNAQSAKPVFTFSRWEEGS